jgi:hypothetical protein
MSERGNTREDILFWPFDQTMRLEEFLAKIHSVYDSLPEEQKATAVAECRSGTFKVYYIRSGTGEETLRRNG